MLELGNHKKSISAGVIVWDGKKFIIGHATGGKHWDIPKGKIDPGEVAIAAAIRELYEETGLTVGYKNLTHLGIFPYKKDKDLSLYLWKVKSLPKIKDLKCHSTFVNKQGITLPEFNKFAHVSFDRLSTKTVAAMTVVLLNVEKILKIHKL